MKFRRCFTTGMAFVLSVAIVEVRFAIDAHAGMITTSQAVANRQRVENIKKVDDFLSRQSVKNELVKQGLTYEEASKRLVTLSDFELQKVAGNIDSAPAGAEPVLVIGLTTLLLIVIIVLLLRH